VDVSVFPDHGEQQGAAGSAVDVVRFGGVAVDQQFVAALSNLQTILCDSCKWFERGPGRSAALGTMAVQCVFKIVSDLVGDGAAKALSGQHAHDEDRPAVEGAGRVMPYFTDEYGVGASM
jgi:hypothetical protein